MTLPPTVEDLGAEENEDNEFAEDPHNEEEEEVQQGVFEEEEEEDDEEDDEDEAPMGSLSRPHAGRARGNSEVVEFDEAIHDITGYEKADIIKLRNKAFKGDALYAKNIKGILLNLPPDSMPSLEQINSSELFALCVPQKNKSENDDDDEEEPREEADVHHLWLPFLTGNGAIGDCLPAQYQPLEDWPKVYNSEGLQTHFPISVSAWKSRTPLHSLIIVVPPDSPLLEKDHVLIHLH